MQWMRSRGGTSAREETPRDRVKPRIEKQRIASYNRKEARERVHTESKCD
jgi:hypothetical protein